MSDIKEPVKYAREVVGNDPFSSYLGIGIDEVKEGYAKCSITVMPQHLNSVDRAHGSLIYALADQAFAVASNSTGNMALSINFNINYISFASDGERIFAEAIPRNIGKKVSVWTVEIRAANDKLIASGEGTAYHK